MTVSRALQDTRPSDHEQKATELLSRAEQWDAAGTCALRGIGKALLAVGQELRAIKAKQTGSLADWMIVIRDRQFQTC